LQESNPSIEHALPEPTRIVKGVEKVVPLQEKGIQMESLGFFTGQEVPIPLFTAYKHLDNPEQPFGQGSA